MKRKCCILEKDVKKDDIDNKHNNEDILMKNKFGFYGPPPSIDYWGHKTCFALTIIFIVVVVVLLKNINILCENFYHYFKWLKVSSHVWISTLSYSKISRTSKDFIRFCIFIARISETAALMLSNLLQSIKNVLQLMLPRLKLRCMLSRKRFTRLLR